MNPRSLSFVESVLEHGLLGEEEVVLRPAWPKRINATIIEANGDVDQAPVYRIVNHGIDLERRFPGVEKNDIVAVVANALDKVGSSELVVTKAKYITAVATASKMETVAMASNEEIK